MPYKIEMVDIVLLQLEEAIFHYEQISPLLGLAFEDEAKRLFMKLSATPQHYFNLPDGVHRRIPFKKFPYLFVYQIKGETVLIKLLFPVKADPAGILALLKN
jgi:hypothetical protein